MNVVIDTNVFISSLLTPAGTPGKIIDLWKEGTIWLCLSQEILDEYLEVIARLGIGDDPAVGQLLKLFKSRCNQLYVSRTVPLAVIESDPHANKFLECALAAGAKFIVSGDKRLLKLKEYEGVKVLTPASFLRQLSDQGG